MLRRNATQSFVQSVLWGGLVSRQPIVVFCICFTISFKGSQQYLHKNFVITYLLFTYNAVSKILALQYFRQSGHMQKSTF